MSYRIIEDQLTILHENLTSMDETIKLWSEAHEKKPNSYHEIYGWCEPLDRFIGVAQYKPGDKTLGSSLKNGGERKQ